MIPYAPVTLDTVSMLFEIDIHRREWSELFRPRDLFEPEPVATAHCVGHGCGWRREFRSNESTYDVWRALVSHIDDHEPRELAWLYTKTYRRRDFIEAAQILADAEGKNPWDR